MNDSFDDAIANMEMPEDPGLAILNIKAPNVKPDEKHIKLSSYSSFSSSSTATKSDNNATTSSAASIVSTTTTTSKNSPNAIQVNPNQKGNPLLKSITSIPYEFNSEIIPDYVVGAYGN